MKQGLSGETGWRSGKTEEKERSKQMKSLKFFHKPAMLLVAITMVLTLVLGGTSPVAAAVSSRTYTLDADFDEGVLVGVEHTTVHDQLQLSKEAVTLPFLWVPNNEGTVSKIDSETGNELGRYRVAPPEGPVWGGNPSRTTVDLQGSCYVGNRQAGTVVKIGLSELGQYVDRNGNGTCETSQDLNHDGDITGAEILPWGADECVLYELVLVPGHEGPYVPGTYGGPYDTDNWGVAPRGLAIDASNNLWAGTWSTQKYYYVNGATGAILNTVDVSPWGHSSYGAALDGNGVLWSAMLSTHVLRMNTANLTDIMAIPLGHTYGLGLDYLSHLFVSGGGQLTRIDINDKVTPKDWTRPARTVRGVVCTSDNDVWVAGYDESLNYDSVVRYDNEANWEATIEVGNSPSGVGVDAAGKVWACNIGDEFVKRIDPATNMVELPKAIVGSGGHYTYSDFTGIVARTITTKIGTWTVVFDSEEVDMPWGKVSWHSDEPTGTSVTVRVRSSNSSGGPWSGWESATNGVPLSTTPDGQYLQIETTLQIVSGDASPILYDLTVEVGVIGVSVDIKPMSWPNPLNVKDKGVLPVAILGTADFDVSQVDPATVRLEGVAPLRWALEDVGQPGVPLAGPDGIMDLSFKFDAQAIVAVLGVVNDGDNVVLHLTGNLKPEFGGTPIAGEDVVVIIKK